MVVGCRHCAPPGGTGQTPPGKHSGSLAESEELRNPLKANPRGYSGLAEFRKPKSEPTAAWRSLTRMLHVFRSNAALPQGFLGTPQVSGTPSRTPPGSVAFPGLPQVSGTPSGFFQDCTPPGLSRDSARPANSRGFPGFFQGCTPPGRYRPRTLAG